MRQDPVGRAGRRKDCDHQGDSGCRKGNGRRSWPLRRRMRTKLARRRAVEGFRAGMGPMRNCWLIARLTRVIFRTAKITCMFPGPFVRAGGEARDVRSPWSRGGSAAADPMLTCDREDGGGLYERIPIPVAAQFAIWCVAARSRVQAFRWRLAISILTIRRIICTNIADSGQQQANLDIGCSPSRCHRMIWRRTGRAVGSIERDPEFKTDRLTSAILEFRSGQCVFLYASRNSALPARTTLRDKENRGREFP